MKVYYFRFTQTHNVHIMQILTILHVCGITGRIIHKELFEFDLQKTHHVFYVRILGIISIYDYA